MTDFGPQIDAGYSCSRSEANSTLLISNSQKGGGKQPPVAGLYLAPPPPNRAHLQSPPPTLSWFGPTPASWAGGSNPIEMLPVDCGGSAPDKFYCCSVSEGWPDSPRSINISSLWFYLFLWVLLTRSTTAALGVKAGPILLEQSSLFSGFMFSCGFN
jgi:hypothetical protein